MRTITVESATTLAMVSGIGLLAAMVPAAAQYMPDGSYAESCHHVYMNGPYLNAVCRRLDGGWSATRIFAPRCGGAGISNHNGILSCGAY